MGHWLEAAVLRRVCPAVRARAVSWTPPGYPAQHPAQHPAGSSCRRVWTLQSRHLFGRIRWAHSFGPYPAVFRWLLPICPPGPVRPESRCCVRLIRLVLSGRCPHGVVFVPSGWSCPSGVRVDLGSFCASLVGERFACFVYPGVIRRWALPVGPYASGLG